MSEVADILADMEPDPLTPAPQTSDDRCPGALRLHEAADGLLARVRVPGGLLTAGQVVALSDAARTLGDGMLSITARGNVEIRGLHGDDVAGRLSRLLAAEGLLPSMSHERVRNIVAGPAAGLDGRGFGSLVEAVGRLDRALCSTPRTADLSGRFLFGLDDGRGDVLPLQPDLVARWISPTHAELHVGGTPVVRLPAEQVPEALVAAAVTFLDARDAAGESGWRIADLGHPEAVADTIATAVTERFAEAHRIDEPEPQVGTDLPHPGPIGDDAVNLVLRLGRAPAATWMALASRARAGDGLVRTTPDRSIVLAGLSADVRAHLLADAPALGLIAEPADPAYGVTACTGLPGCDSARADVRADVDAALAEIDAHAAAGVESSEDRLPVHVSGCERRCGHPRHTHHEAVARPRDPERDAADESAYATAVVHGSPAAGAPLPDGHDPLAALLSARHEPA